MGRNGQLTFAAICRLRFLDAPSSADSPRRSFAPVLRINRVAHRHGTRGVCPSQTRLVGSLGRGNPVKCAFEWESLCGHGCNRAKCGGDRGRLAGPAPAPAPLFKIASFLRVVQSPALTRSCILINPTGRSSSVMTNEVI